MAGCLDKCYGWMNAWMSGGMYGWMGAWMDKCLDEWICILYDSLDGGMEAWMHVCMLEWMNEFLRESMDVCLG